MYVYSHLFLIRHPPQEVQVREEVTLTLPLLLAAPPPPASRRGGVVYVAFIKEGEASIRKDRHATHGIAMPAP